MLKPIRKVSLFLLNFRHLALIRSVVFFVILGTAGFVVSMPVHREEGV